MVDRWAPELVLSLAPDASVAAAARGLAVPGRWSATGSAAEAAWGLCHGSGAEPYQVMVELSEPGWRCTCPSRKLPCKHGVALLLLWAHGHVPQAPPPAAVVAWLAMRAARSASAAARLADVVPTEPKPESASPPTPVASGAPSGPVPPPGPSDKRAERVSAGLADLDRWVTDRVRTGLTDPALARYATWDQQAARLVDAQAPSLANRVRRLAGVVGTRPGWHEHVLAELGVLHALASAGRNLVSLPEPLADSVRTAVGWQVRQADVLAMAPVTDQWHVAGRSDVLEDRIVVRRTWLVGAATGRWALLLSFAAYGQSLGGEPRPGTQLHADLHLYPGAVSLRAVLGVVHAPAAPDDDGPHAATLAGACDLVGGALALEPWLERHPVTVRAAPTVADGRWVLTDHTGTLPLAAPARTLAVLACCSGGRPVNVTAEWTPDGLVPLTVHLASGAVDIGPRGGWHERRPA